VVMKANVRTFWQLLKKYPHRAFGFMSLSILLIIAGYGSVRGARLARGAFFSCPIVDITCIDCYSPRAKKELVAFVRENMFDVNYLSFDATNFYSSLRARFNYVTKVVITKRLPKGLCVRIEGVKPVMFVSQNLVLADDRGVYSRDHFSLYAGLDQLPRVSFPAVHAGMKIMPWVSESLHNLALKLGPHYECTYTDPSYIRLIPRTQRLFACVVANENALFNTSQLDGLDAIVQDALHRGLCSSKMLETKRRSVELDIRFERRVIVKFIDHAKRRGKVS
jgi:hypothetical protein